ncbi:MAG: M20/M25/M40 family metallo-hydrolase, partial [Alphaproteobacteria bacterium]
MRISAGETYRPSLVLYASWCCHCLSCGFDTCRRERSLSPLRARAVTSASVNMPEIADEVVARIDRDKLVQFALEICNIDSAVPFEAAVAEHIYQWLKREGFTARRVGLLSDRFNVLGTLAGSGGGYSLIFNSHMDTAVPRQRDLVHRDPANDVYHKAWVEGDLLIGEGICNDKGPMAAFLMAAKAIKDSGHQLKGDLLVSSVVAETSREPCDDAPG